MYKILTLNAISPIYHDYLSDSDYEVSSSMENPDAIIVRSADMHNMEAPASLVAVARAGAGYNNIPVDKLAQKGVVVFNTPGANANAVKELAVAGLLLGSRDNDIQLLNWGTKSVYSSIEIVEGMEAAADAL